MVFETLIEDNKTVIPDEILKKIKGKELIKWNLKKDGRIELEVEEIPSECKTLAREFSKINAEIDTGNYVKGDRKTLEKRCIL
ncbi:MAG: hypothetical protein FWH29_11120 [Methanobrevibacter sp.]|nr:hypothetical protein [Methanobrevibacter sp.]